MQATMVYFVTKAKAVKDIPNILSCAGVWDQ